MAVNVGSLLVSLGLDSGEFKSGLSQAEKEFKRSVRRIDGIGKSMANVGRNLSLAVTAPLVALGVTSVKAAVESNQAFASVEAALKSMGSQAGFTAKQLEEVASGIMRKSLYDDDEVLRKVTATMLTFGKVTGDTFLRAQQAAVDLSALFGKDLQSSAVMVGKALQDPTKGLTALSRAGVSFSPAQAKVIKSLVETGQAAKAQEMILKELEKQVIGQAQAMRNADPLAAMRLSFGEFQEEIGKKLLPLLPRLTDAITGVLNAFGKLSLGVQTALIATAGLAAAFGPLLMILAPITTGIMKYIAAINLSVGVVDAAGVATTGWQVALASLRATLLTLVQTLGPIALALGVVAGAIYIITRRSQEGTKASAEYREQQKKLGEMQARVTDATTKLASATGKAREEALANARALRQETLQYLANAKAALIAARAKARQKFLEAEEVRFSAGNAMSSGSAMALGGNFAGQRTDVAARQARTDAKAAADTVKGLEAELNRLNTIIGAPPPQVSSDGVAGVDKATRGSARKVKEEIDRTAEIERRFNDELISYTQQTLSARQGLAMNAEERAELELRGLELARTQTLDAIKADEEYTDVQKQRLAQQVEVLADYERQAIARNLASQLEQERNDLLQIAFDSEREQLALQADVADTQAERKTLAMQILALEQEYRRNMLEMVLASETASDAEKARAQAILDSLGAIEAGERKSVGRANETELENWLRNANKSPQQMAEARIGIGLEGLDKLAEGLSRIAGEAKNVQDAFKMMKDVFANVIKEMLADLIKLQLQKAMAGLVSGILGGGTTASYSGIDLRKFATGTSFAPGGLALVGERGPELVDLPRGSRVFPNGQTRDMLSGSSGGNAFTWNVFAQDANSFRKSERQMQNEARRRLG